MEFGWTDEQLALKKELRQFVAENIPEEIRGRGEGIEATRETEGDDAESRNAADARRAVMRKIADKGWKAISWPKEYGGQDGDRMDQYITEEEFCRAGLSVGGGGSGAGAILAAGTEEQKQEFIPAIIRGEVSFALGFTEPRGGADLANLQCSAVRDGDFYIINGQKTFTSSAHNASHIYMMVRTDREANPPHRGISILLVPIDLPGITVRPIWTVASDPLPPWTTTYGFDRTNEVFFEDVRVPISALLGEENRGWYVGQAALNLDRVGAWRYFISVQQDEYFINWIKDNDFGGLSLKEDPAVRDKLAELWIEGQVCRLMTMRSMSMVQRDQNFTYEGSAEKVWNPEHGMRSTEAFAQILGPYAQLLNGSPEAVMDGTFAHNILTFWVSGNNHGSTHIMRDQIARRGFELPVRHN